MTQTATFPNLESLPTVSTTGILYFSATMGTLTEVDVVTSGSFQTQFSAENLGSTQSTIQGTTTGNLAINVPTGTIPVTIPSVTETFDASAFNGSLDYSAPSGKDFAPVTSSSTPQTTVLTAPADLAAFTGHFRIPISVSGHASGSATSDNGQLSAAFQTQTSATITVTYHYIPNLPSLDPPPSPSQGSPPPSSGSAPVSSGSPASSSTSGTNAGLIGPTDASQGVPTPSARHHASSTPAKRHGHIVTGTSHPKGGHHVSRSHSRLVTNGLFHVGKTHRFHHD